jgi:hypothetical protein
MKSTESLHLINNENTKQLLKDVRSIGVPLYVKGRNPNRKPHYPETNRRYSFGNQNMKKSRFQQDFPTNLSTYLYVTPRLTTSEKRKLDFVKLTAIVELYEKSDKKVKYV